MKREKIFNVISYGETLEYYHRYMNYAAPGITTIGVNDIEKEHPECDHILLVDDPSSFTPDRLEIIKRSWPLSFFIVSLNWMKVLRHHRCVPITLTTNRSDLSTLKHPLNFQSVPYSYNSPFIAACLAYRMGAERINLFGVDFNTDSSIGYEFHEQNIIDFKNLYNELQKLGVKMYTTHGSRLAEFIPINPDIKPIKIKQYA